MYDYNTLEGKIHRVEELHRLQIRIACIPGKYLSYLEAGSLNQYLADISRDLEKQIRKEQKARQEEVRIKTAAVNKALFDHWGTEKAARLWDELEKCASPEEIAQLYDLVFKPT